MSTRRRDSLMLIAFLFLQPSLGTRSTHCSSPVARKVPSSTGTSHPRRSLPPPRRSPSNPVLARRSRRRTTRTSGRSPSIHSAISSSAHPTTTPRASGAASGLETPPPCSPAEARNRQRSRTRRLRKRTRRRWCPVSAWARAEAAGGAARRKTRAMGRQARGRRACRRSVHRRARWTRAMT